MQSPLILLPSLELPAHRKSGHSVSFAHSASLNPTNTISSVTASGRFTSIPFVARSCNCSSSLIVGSLSFNFISLYNIPLVLKNFFSGNPLNACHFFNSSYVGFSSTIWRCVYATPCSSSHFPAFWQVEHFG